MTELRIGRALVDAGRFWGTHLIPCVLLAAAVYAPVVVLGRVLAYLGSDLPGSTIGSTIYGVGVALSGHLLDALLATWVAARLAETALARETVAQAWLVGRLGGRPCGLRESVAATARRLPVVAGTAVALTLLLNLPSALPDPSATLLAALTIVALVGACGLFVAMPVAVLEDVGVGGAVRRSWSLTRGVRLRIFGLFLVLGIGIAALLAIANSEIGGWTVPMTVLVGSFNAVLATVVYAQLRATEAQGARA